jgi:hypothetical protein
MHALFVAPSYTPFIGGAQTFQEAMAHRLVADGWHVTVLATNARHADDFWRPPRSGPPLPDREERDGVCIRRLPLGHWLQASPLPVAIQRPLLGYFAHYMPPLDTLQSIMDDLVCRVDLVQATDATWDGLFVAASRAARRHNRPFVAVPLIHTGSRRITAHFLMAHQIDAYRQAQAVLALSHGEATLLARQGVQMEHLHVLPMGVDSGMPAPALWLPLLGPAPMTRGPSRCSWL